MMTRRKRHVRAYASVFLLDTGLIRCQLALGPPKDEKDLSGYSPWNAPLLNNCRPAAEFNKKTGPRH